MKFRPFGKGSVLREKLPIRESMASPNGPLMVEIRFADKVKRPSRVTPPENALVEVKLITEVEAVKRRRSVIVAAPLEMVTLRASDVDTFLSSVASRGKKAFTHHKKMAFVDIRGVFKGTHYKESKERLPDWELPGPPPIEPPPHRKR